MYLYSNEYPHVIDNERSETWSVDNLEDIPNKEDQIQNTNVIVGEIDEVLFNITLHI